MDEILHNTNIFFLTMILFFRKMLSVIFIFIVFQCKLETSNSDGDLLWSVLIQPEISWKVFFSYPGRNTPTEKKEQAKKELIQLIDSTSDELIIHIYGLTDLDVIDSIYKAISRGVKVQIKVDSDRNYDDMLKLEIPLNIWSGSGLHHPKVVISDRKKIFTGTGNFTKQGLLLDFDSYIIFQIPESIGNDFKIFMDEQYQLPFFQFDGFLFLNAPREGVQIQNRIIEAIRSAKYSIKYLIYTHYDPIISFELIRAAKRGVLVEGIYDRPINPEGIFLAKNITKFGSKIYEEQNEDRIDNGTFGLGGLLHHKTMIIDNDLLLSGSFNFSKSARDNNRELYYETSDYYLISEHLQEFNRIRNYSAQIMDYNLEELENSFYYNPDPDSTPFTEFDNNSANNSSLDYYVFEYGFGLFHSMGVANSMDTNKLKSISSNLFSKNGSNFNIPLNDIGTWFTRHDAAINLESSDSNTAILNANALLSWQRDSYLPIHLESLEQFASSKWRLKLATNSIAWTEVLFWNESGLVQRYSLQPIEQNGYTTDVLLEGQTIKSLPKSGILLFRKGDENFSAIACYNRKGTQASQKIENIWKENLIRIRGGMIGEGTNCTLVQ
ncbi:phospholipase D-like domain-containing protein [Leptospira sp. GIMC2001]|uniref:phospholipase D-like domain-containing protein n=1 Tax=Leptospira sp. GIMC2001 TaxID=1513297 RepID=UPI00234900C1|nr:phospholipase D-like domain-containing protein [Leptospira sp. GIMC2001]WCL48290.1 phospholipase D-like domain-containing protein [Leptospira sp. GIMC2001]